MTKEIDISLRTWELDGMTAPNAPGGGMPTTIFL